MIKPGDQSFRDAIEIIRDYITVFNEEFDKIIHTPELEKHFTAQGLLRVLFGYGREHPQAEWLMFIKLVSEISVDAEVFVTEAAKLVPHYEAV